MAFILTVPLRNGLFFIYNTMENSGFDSYAEKYDSWFLRNRNVLYSEAALVAYFLGKDEKILSVGCGSGLFEQILASEYGIRIVDGVEPSSDMAAIAAARGMDVEISTAEECRVRPGMYDTVLYNGCPGYIGDLGKALERSYSSLREGGKIVLIDIPKESSYGILYNLVKALGTWEHPLLAGVAPADPYPVDLVSKACWRTTAEKVEAMEKAGFGDFCFAQTLTSHPLYSDNSVEQPVPGFDRGDYVAICGYRK